MTQILRCIVQAFSGAVSLVCLDREIIERAAHLASATLYP